MKKYQLYKILFLICFWTSCTIFITVYDAAILGFKSEIDGPEYDFFLTLLLVIGVTLIGSSLLGTIEVLVFSKLFRKKPLGLTLFVKSLVYLMFMIFFISIALLFIYSSDLSKPLFHEKVISGYLNFVSSVRIIMSLFYWGFCCFLGLFILQINDKFGRGVLFNFLLGKYHKPKEENRIFMFMDLKSSTEYAEQLGHIKYSELIQDCFFDLTEIISEFEADIYQYVGDEVVLTWKTEAGLTNSNCIRAFPEFDNLIQNKKIYYQNKYKVVPEFKAGLHMGKVTLAEVGELKKELAYHGDVINTASRIQEKCNEFNTKLLVSEQLLNSLDQKSTYQFEFAGNVILKGKSIPVKIFKLKQQINTDHN